MTRQTPYVGSIVEAIGGYGIPEIDAVREFHNTFGNNITENSR